MGKATPQSFKNLLAKFEEAQKHDSDDEDVHDDSVNHMHRDKVVQKE